MTAIRDTDVVPERTQLMAEASFEIPDDRVISIPPNVFMEIWNRMPPIARCTVGGQYAVNVKTPYVELWFVKQEEK